MTTFLLIRHAAHDRVGAYLAGRTPGVRLGEAGLAQAERLAARLRRETISALYCSPLERTRQTADAIAVATGLPIAGVLDEIAEVAFGIWSGRDFDDLNQDPEWRLWNMRRSLARTPGGETYSEVQRRAVLAIERLAAEGPDETLALVSHGDVIRSVVLHYLGMRIDDWWRVEIGPASITRLSIDGRGTRLLGLNEVVD